MNARKAVLSCSPAQALAGWPAEVPLAAVWSGGAGRHARWTVLARPGRVEVNPRGLAPATSGRTEGEGPPFRGGWIGMVSYDARLGLEPRAGNGGAAVDMDWPDAVWMQCEDALVYDGARREWWEVGSPPRLVEGTARGYHATLGPSTPREEYESWVERALEYIRAGDVYQVNLAHRLEGRFEGSARSLFAGLADRAGPWFGAYLEWDQGPRRVALASASPELFLSYEAGTRRVVTRPMKGTRRAGPGAAASLAESAKDRAELAMIVDLMRNDLGRVCELGSVRVETARAIEEHGASVVQASGEVSGVLEAGAGVAELLAGTFPPGSVTGAPKVRAMQIIDELETVRRGPYCGAIGYVSDTGDAAFSVAIRTAAVHGAVTAGGRDQIVRGRLHYSVGAGIVAESDPGAEWRETLDKAAVIRDVVEWREAAEVVSRAGRRGSMRA